MQGLEINAFWDDFRRLRRAVENVEKTVAVFSYSDNEVAIALHHLRELTAALYNKYGLSVDEKATGFVELTRKFTGAPVTFAVDSIKRFGPVINDGVEIFTCITTHDDRDGISSTEVAETYEEVKRKIGEAR